MSVQSSGITNGLAITKPSRRKRHKTSKRILIGAVYITLLFLSASYGFAAGFTGEKAETIVKDGTKLHVNSSGKAFFFSVVYRDELHICQQTIVLNYMETVCFDNEK